MVNFQKVLNLISYLLIFMWAFLAFFILFLGSPFTIILLGISGAYFSVFLTYKISGTIPRVKRNQRRIGATLALLAILLSAIVFVFYPTASGVIGLVGIYFVSSVGFLFVGWHENKKNEYLMAHTKSQV